MPDAVLSKPRPPEWTREQLTILKHPESALLVGGPGSGKTALLLEKTVRLLASGNRVALCTFSFRGMEHLRAVAQGAYPQLTAQVATGKLQSGTVMELAARALQTAGNRVAFISNNQVRDVLRTLVVEQSFPGTLEEAYHVIRSAKGRAKKLPENDRYYSFVTAYQQKLEALGLQDRHDIIRRHVLGIKEGKVTPVPVDDLLLDHLPDATELQLIWLQMHLNAGIRLTLAADDDTTVFARDGALGPAAVTQVESWEDMARFDLPASYRLPAGLAPGIVKVARQLRTRVDKPEATLNAVPGALQTETFPTPAAEHQWLVSTCSQLMALHQEGRTGPVGVITREDFTANLVAHVLRKNGLKTADFGRLIWENPTPQLVLAMLYVMLGQANNAQLQLVLLGFGVPGATVTGLFQQGLSAENWLARGCPLPPLEGLSPTVMTLAQRVRRAFSGAWQLLQARQVSPRDVFRSLVAEVLPMLPEGEHRQALLATDVLLSLSGKLTEILPRVMQETMPDMQSPITVAPVREVRNMQFHTVILPHAGAGDWPRPPHTLLGPNPDHERRLFYLAASRTSHTLILTWHTPQPTPFLAEIQQALSKRKT